jgi:hypothetical protein
MTDAVPPKTLPEEMFDAFTYNGQVTVRPWSGGVLNQQFLGNKVRQFFLAW